MTFMKLNIKLTLRNMEIHKTNKIHGMSSVEETRKIRCQVPIPPAASYVDQIPQWHTKELQLYSKTSP